MSQLKLQSQKVELITPIAGVEIEPRKIFSDDRGGVMHMLKMSETTQPIAEVYFSTIRPHITKGWKRHKRMWQRFAVPVGEIEFRFVDDRPASPTTGNKSSIRVSRNNHVLITVPPGIWYSFKCVSDVEAVIVNAASVEHDPEEIETKPLD